ncbi:MAG: HAD-IIB family hydrolase [Gammaproteobacteria bacterium]|nr:HAD-IIB family hydrolase [Gammaproteobacteria bacterium]MBU2024542.1 HAD-IIB family hydrolase [Gammaproteobacteria bacterium]MBU2317620.1 HAD-IIB family hydrolase [Gammaproteobacteria bacterium]
MSISVSSSLGSSGLELSALELSSIDKSACQGLRFILTDFDDTLTWEGQLPVETLRALAQLEADGIKVIPVTGGCAGWSDMIARALPVDGVITEGGACFIGRTADRHLTYSFWRDESEMRAEQAHILTQVNQVLTQFPRLRLARDQAYRLTDVAIDYAQDVKPAAVADKEACLAALIAMGLNAKASSIHINVCSQGYDKFSMAQRVLGDVYGLSEAQQQEQVLYVGDAPNDESMFARFPLSVGVANIAEHLSIMSHHPRYQTTQPGGLGFAELAEFILSARQA